MPRLSVGLPVYNGEDHLEETLVSLLAQTYTDFELIISDNASTDHTSDICSSYAAKDGRVRYYRNATNLGARANYNRVFSLASGEYFKWAAHDDLYASRHFEACVEVLEADPSVVLCYPKALIIDEKGDVICSSWEDNMHLASPCPAERLRGYFVAGSWIFHPVFGVIRRNALQRTPLIANYVGSDLTLLACLALQGKFHEVPSRLFLRREHPQRSGNLTIPMFATWWDPSNRSLVYFPQWRRVREYGRIIATATISPRTKLSCMIALARWLYWQRENLRDEIRSGLAVGLGRIWAPIAGS